MEPSNRLKQAAELFHAALERAPSQRTAFLIDACATDPDLLKEVQSLLSAHEQLSSFLNAPEIAAMRMDAGKSTSQFEINQMIDHYRIISLLGRGGMSEVYLAQDTKLHRHVALKLLRANLTRDKQRLKRFQQEACAASALSHPNILTIHGSGQQGDLHFIVTEYIEGKTLRQMLIEGKLTLGHALDVVVQVSGALAAAFAAGIIHRDIKPENIIVRPDGYVKVLDFGLAKLTGREDALPWLSSFSILDTSPGMVMGTVNYMSPEQARGLPVDGGSDIFSLGVVLYEMLTGRPPFDGKTPSDVIASILEKEPLPLTLYWPEVPFELQRIVSKTLQKERNERYQFIKDLHLELKNLKRDLEFDATLQHELVSQTSNEVIARWRSKQSLGGAVNRSGSAISVNLRRSKPAQFKAVITRHKWAATLALLVLLFIISPLLYFSLRARQSNETITAPRRANSSTSTNDSEQANGLSVILRDEFNDGDIGTNTGGVGSGFDLRTFTGNGSVVETDGSATISGTATIKYLQSKDSFDPIGKTLTWVISKRSAEATQGVSIGWVQANKVPCCNASVLLGIEGQRIYFDIQAKASDDPFQQQGRYVQILFGSTSPDAIYTNAASPVTASIYVDSAQWKIDLTGDGVDIHKSGNYTSCPNPVKNSCISLSDVLIYKGVNRRLHAFASASRENISGTFDSVVVANMVAMPDLNITMNHTGDFTAGIENQYTITVTNLGQGSTTGDITMTNILPPGVGYIDMKSTGWFCASVSQTITCTRAQPLEAGKAASLILTVMPGKAGTFVPAVSVSTPQDGATGTKSATDVTVIQDKH
jgi:uncharacterized repeat protein (TIGR01451 family)